MIRLGHKDLSAESAAELKRLQSKVDEQASFEARAQKAQSLWGTKGGKKGKLAFESIKTALDELCVFVGVCNYCEQNEASDIEHIFPKSFFPESTFVWENYLLACKHCNSTFKLDKIHILDPTDELVLLPRKVEPPSKRIAFINPRLEDPATYLWLNTSSFEFELHDGLDKAMRQKGTATLAILELNARDTLVKARMNASTHYYLAMRQLVEILQAKDIGELKDALTPGDEQVFDLTLPLDDLKQDILESRRRYVRRYQHPSVWEAIKAVEAKVTPKWQAIFAKIPEALTW